MDIPLVLRKHNVICGVLHHPGDIGEYPMFRKANGDDIPEDETDNDPVLAKEFWEDFIHMTVATLCKFASRKDDDPTTFVDLGYQYSIMQKLMNSQLKEPDETPTRTEIKARVKTQLQRLIPHIAENLTFNSLSGPGSFKTTFYDWTPYEETGSWKSKLYKGTNIVYSNSLKGVYNLFNEEIERHN